ncbi:MAG: ribonuclease H-like domain-containing protein [Halobacteriales archaeon]
MYTLDLSGPDRFGSYGILDIETTGLDGAEDDLVAVGLGYYEDSAAADVEVITRASVRNDERALMSEAYAWLTRRKPEGLVTYNGAEFDLPFLRAKADALGVDRRLPLEDEHLDLFSERKRLAEQANAKWPRLEECLEAYGLPVPETMWDGAVLTNERFGEEVGPRYLTALETLEFERVHDLESTIREYTAADIEATIALYEADVGRGDGPSDSNGRP